MNEIKAKSTVPAIARVANPFKSPRKFSSDAEAIRIWSQEFKRCWDAQQNNFDRMWAAWKFVFALPGEQWDAKIRKYKQEREQRYGQYNMVGPKIDLYAAAVEREKFDARFDPIDGTKNSGIYSMENAYYCDKELCDYDREWGNFIYDAVIHEGILEPKITYRFDWRGNIYFKRAMPGEWVLDPLWRSDDDDDLALGYKHANMTLRQMFGQFKNLPSTPELDEAITHLKDQGMSWDEPKFDDYKDSCPVIEGTYHVIERHWTEEIRKKRLIYYDPDGNPQAFPVTDDMERLDQFARSINVEDWSRVEAVPYRDRIHYCSVFCQDLFPFNLIDKGKPEIQVGGMPVIHLTMHRDPAGRNKGIPEDLIDPQKDINYNKSKIQEYLANALGGCLVYDRTRMQGKTKQEEFARKINDPMGVVGVDGPVDGLFKRAADHNINPELVRQGAESVDFLDRIGSIPAAMHAETQSSNEPAKLYEMKLQMANLGIARVKDRIKYAMQRRSEMWYAQGQISYAGYERKFTSRDGSKEAVLNEDIGGGYIRNKVDDMPRISVTMSEAPDSMSRTDRIRSEWGSVLKTIPPELGLREPILIAMEELIKTVHLPQDKIQQLEESFIIERVAARVGKMAEIAGGEANTAQSKLVTEQVLAQLQQMVAQTGGLQQQGQPQQQSEEIPEMISKDTGSVPENVPGNPAMSPEEQNQTVLPSQP